MSKRERSALLTWVAWWHGRILELPEEAWRAVYDWIPDSDVGDSHNARWRIAESMAYDGTRGP